MALTTVATEAVAWATVSESGRAKALAELAIKLAGEITRTPVGEESSPPIAALSKELRATLADLEALRDGTAAETSLGVVLSAPVWDTEKPRPAKPRATRRKSTDPDREATDAVAAPRRGRSARGAS